jgi:hypothetical protein
MTASGIVGALTALKAQREGERVGAVFGCGGRQPVAIVRHWSGIAERGEQIKNEFPRRRSRLGRWDHDDASPGSWRPTRLVAASAMRCRFRLALGPFMIGDPAAVDLSPTAMPLVAVSLSRWPPLEIRLPPCANVHSPYGLLSISAPAASTAR